MRICRDQLMRFSRCAWDLLRFETALVQLGVEVRGELPGGAGMAVSNDGTLLVTISHDQSVKVFDVLNFDMMMMLKLPFVPSCAEWVFRVRLCTLEP